MIFKLFGSCRTRASVGPHQRLQICQQRLDEYLNGNVTPLEQRVFQEPSKEKVLYTQLSKYFMDETAQTSEKRHPKIFYICT